MSSAKKKKTSLHDASARPDCILCGKCLEVCPLFRATGREELSPKAKFYLAEALRKDDKGLRAKAAGALAELCLSCGKCEQACPRGLCAPDLISGLRADHPGWDAWVWEKWVERASLLWPLFAAISRHAPDALPMKKNLAALDAAGRLKPWLRPVSFNACAAGRKAVTFLGCVAEHARTDWKETTRGLLGGLGVDLLPDPGFACCGCTVGHAGLLEAQLSMRRRNVAAWRAAGRPEIVVICATCRCGLRAYASRFDEFEPGEAELWLGSVVSLSELLGDTTFEILDGAPKRALHHKPCHGARGNQDYDLLRRMMGDRLLPQHPESPCCGFGGLLRLTAPGLSDRVAAKTWEIYGPAPGTQVLTGCSGCVTQLKATAPEGTAVGHWLETICL